MNNKRNLLIMIITLSLILILGSSYAYLVYTKESTNNYVINVGTLEVTFVDSKTEFLNLSNMYPMTDEEGKELTKELVFQIKNTGNINGYYNVSIEEISTNPEFKNVIRYIVNKNQKGYYEIKTLGTDKYIDKESYIAPNEIIEYRVKLWLAEEADNTYMNKEFKAKVVVDSLQADNLDKSGANSPELVSNLIPIYYDNVENVFKKADSKNLEIKNKWYDYGNNEEAKTAKIKNSNTYIIDSENKTIAMAASDGTYFDGLADYYDLGNARYDFKNSISVVIRFKMNVANSYNIISNTEGGGFAISLLANGAIESALHIGSDYNRITSVPILKTGEWYTVVLNYDGSSYNLYINGKQEGETISMTDNITVSPDNILLGAEPGPNNVIVSYLPTFNGIISDAYVYTKALTMEQINNYFTGQITDYPKENLLVSNKDITPKEKRYTLVDDGLYFDGVDDYLNLGYENYDFKNSVSFVLRFNLKNVTSDQRILSNTEFGGSSFQVINNSLIFQSHINGNYNGVTTNINSETWYTAVGTYDGKSVKLYINGELKGTNDIVGNIGVSSKNIILGAEVDSNTMLKYFNGTISDVFIYTDTLTEKEIKDYFNGEINYYPKDNVLVSYNGFKETNNMEEFYKNASQGTKIMDNDIEAIFKWIPRFQYDTNIKFIKEIEKPKNTHLAFTYNNKELLGYYVTDNNSVKINNIENVSDYHSITTQELDGVKKLNSSDNLEYKQTLAIFQK